MKKALSMLLLGLLAVCLVTLVLIFVLPEDTGVSIMLIWAYILLGLATLAAVIFPLMHLAQNPKAAMRSLIGVAIVIVVVGLSFAFSSAEPMNLSDKTVFTNAFSLRLSDAGLYTAYTAIVVAIIATIYGEIRNSIK